MYTHAYTCTRMHMHTEKDLSLSIAFCKKSYTLIPGQMSILVFLATSPYLSHSSGLLKRYSCRYNLLCLVFFKK